MPEATIVVYLDSNDYSTLSDPRRSTNELSVVRAELLDLAKSASVQFAFSGAHLSEMAPLEAKYHSAATARASLLSELCGRNAFISFDRLIKAEIAALAAGRAAPAMVLSDTSDWFPELGEILSPRQWNDTARAIDAETKDRGLNRVQRRVLNRKLFRANQPKPAMRDWLASQDAGTNLDDILRIYPMRPQDAKVLARYVLGQATRQEAEAAFLESLRDPRWMMQWFAEHHDKLTTVTEWVRGPSRDMVSRMKELAAAAKEVRRLESVLGPDFKADMLTRPGWQATQDELLLNVANRLRHQFHPESPPVRGVAAVDLLCPGLSTALRSLHSALWDSVGAQPRTPKDSDFVDAVHAMYAPYSSVFRADRYMAPHIQKLVASRGVRVVSQLESLPGEIRSLLQ